VDALAQLAAAQGAYLLQDACETMDLRVRGAPASDRGTLSTWSFYHPHHLSSYGGGAVLSSSEEWQREVESVSHWGRACACHAGLACFAPEGMNHQFSYPRIGANLEMSELNACFGRFQLRSWDEQEKQRRLHYRIMVEALRGIPGLTVWDAPPDSGSPFVFPMVLERGDVPALARRLAGRGVEVRSLMGGAIADQPAYAQLETDGLRRCRDLSRRSFFAGVHQTLPEADVRAVAEILRAVLSEPR
jgi:CDP-6-deoxy-D-xylo-4-hexulose-3-dehydrase